MLIYSTVLHVYYAHCIYDQSNAKLLSLRCYFTCTHYNITMANQNTCIYDRVYCRNCGGISMISISTQYLTLFAQILAKNWSRYKIIVLNF